MLQQQVINIQMLGRFSMELNGKVLVSSPRTKKVWLLLEYLIYNRGTQVTQEELLQLLWNQKECDSPASALKNLIYRGRQFLRGLPEGEAADFICYQDGRYFWNLEWQCHVDCEEMERLSIEAQHSGNPDRRMQLLRDAAALYQGDFLPLMDFSGWTLEKRRYYERIYQHCLAQMQEIYREKQQYEEGLRLGEWAAEKYPDHEELQSQLMRSYLDAGCRQRAVAHYNAMIHRFNSSQFSSHLHSLYADMALEKHSIDFDFTAVQEILRDEEDEVGAFFCSFDIFRNIYRLQARMLLRGGRRFYVGLLSLSRPDGLNFLRDELHQVVEAVKETLIVGLRRGDAVAQYAENQFVMMLPIQEESEGYLVMDRLSRSYQAHYPALHVNWDVRFSRIEPPEEWN